MARPQGRESSQDEIGASALLAKEMDDKLNDAAVQVCCDRSAGRDCVCVCVRERERERVAVVRCDINSACAPRRICFHLHAGSSPPSARSSLAERRDESAQAGVHGLGRPWRLRPPVGFARL